jgi:hypothetical protein
MSTNTSSGDVIVDPCVFNTFGTRGTFQTARVQKALCCNTLQRGLTKKFLAESEQFLSVRFLDV